MGAFELARYRVEKGSEDELLARWPAAVEAIRSRFPGLVQARLGSLGEGVWVDVWEWESVEAARRAAEGAPSVPEAAAMFEVIAEPLAMEHADIVASG